MSEPLHQSRANGPIDLAGNDIGWLVHARLTCGAILPFAVLAELHYWMEVWR